LPIKLNLVTTSSWSLEIPLYPIQTMDKYFNGLVIGVYSPEGDNAIWVVVDQLMKM
jgi:hypothetical protein